RARVRRQPPRVRRAQGLAPAGPRGRARRPMHGGAAHARDGPNGGRRAAGARARRSRRTQPRVRWTWWRATSPRRGRSALGVGSHLRRHVARLRLCRVRHRRLCPADRRLVRLEWVWWFNHHRLQEPLGYLPPTEYGEHFHRTAETPVSEVALT